MSILIEILELPFLRYPNPASQGVFIQKPESIQIYTVRFYNGLGQLLSERPFTAAMDVSSFSAGILFIQFQTNTGTITKSLLKN